MTKGDEAVICDITSGSSSVLYDGFEIAAERGATEVEAVLLTHYHERHVGALGSFMQSKRVRRLYIPEPESTADAEIMARLFYVAEREGVACFTYSADEVLTVFNAIEINAAGVKIPEGFYHPNTSIYIKDEDQSFAYVSSSCIAKEEAVDALVIGSHGPQPKPDGGFLLPRAKELYIAERELLDSVVRKGNIETYGRVFVDCDIVSLVFD
jgi:glyoxylase-like metal-dependent hydrolase (beta-lactamase superfamily II)